MAACSKSCWVKKCLHLHSLYAYRMMSVWLMSLLLFWPEIGSSWSFVLVSLLNWMCKLFSILVSISVEMSSSFNWFPFHFSLSVGISEIYISTLLEVVHHESFKLANICQSDLCSLSFCFIFFCRFFVFVFFFP